MAVALKTLFDKRKLALTGARLHAWWEGEAFDEAAAVVAYEAKLAEAAANDKGPEGADEELFDEPPFDMPGRLVALGILWGEGRLRPKSGVAEGLEPARVGLAADGVLAMIGPGLVGPVAAVAAIHPGNIDAFEWRDESFEALQYGLARAKLDKRVTLARLDLEAHVFKANHYDGLLSADDFAYCGYPPHLAQQIMKCLKPGACAIVESYVGLPSPALATAFASSFAEPQIRAHGDLLKFFADAGLQLESDEDITEECLEAARAGFKHLGESIVEAGKLDVNAARELAWEAEAWRGRMRLMTQRRLERRRLVLRKQASTQTGNENAPAG
jgi:hypothetical protein